MLFNYSPPRILLLNSELSYKFETFSLAVQTFPGKTENMQLQKIKPVRIIKSLISSPSKLIGQGNVFFSILVFLIPC